MSEKKEESKSEKALQKDITLRKVNVETARLLKVMATMLDVRLGYMLELVVAKAYDEFRDDQEYFGFDPDWTRLLDAMERGKYGFGKDEE